MANKILKEFNDLKFYVFNVKGLLSFMAPLSICSNYSVCSNNNICGNYTNINNIEINIMEE